MHKALIIGAGQIAGGFDAPDSSAVLTHAHAYQKHPDFELLGFYDIDFDKAKAMAEKWKCQTYENLCEIAQVDVISICVPDEYHVETVLKAAALHPKIIFLEKPVVRNKADIEILRNVQTPILVNYSRRFSKDIQALAEGFKAGELGKYINGCGVYGKGFIHNGSHMIDLLNLLIGKINYVETIDEIDDFYQDDKSKNVILHFDNGCKFFMQVCDCRNYTIFELDLFFEKARVRLANSAFEMEVFEVKDSEQFSGYKNLFSKGKILTDLGTSMYNAVDNMAVFLRNNQPLLCTLDDGWEAIKHG